MYHDPRFAMTSGAGGTVAAPAGKGPRRWPALILLFCFVGLMWVVEAADRVLVSVTGNPHNTLESHGVEPLSTDGLLGILFQPLLHGDWAHLIGNSIALLVLGSIIAMSGVRPLVTVTVVLWLASGLGAGGLTMGPLIGDGVARLILGEGAP